MAIYELLAVRSPETTAEMIILKVAVLRDGDEVQTWVARFPSVVDDASIRAEIEKRAKDFVKIDKSSIEKNDNQTRADAIASALTGVDLEKA